MNSSIKRYTPLALVLFSSLEFCFADAPLGLVTISFDSPSAAVWDLSGDYLMAHPIGLETLGAASGQTVPLGFGITLTNETRGRLIGTGVTGVLIGTDFVAANYIALGVVRSVGDDRRATLLVRLTGQDIIAGALRNFSISIHYALAVDSEAGILAGKARGSISVAGLGTGPIRTPDFSTGLPPGQNGTWSVQMNVLPLNKLGGTATIVLSNGRAFPLNLTGSFSPLSNVSRVRLLGFNEGQGISISVRFIVTVAGPSLVSLRGILLGQFVQDQVEAPPP